MDDSIEWKEAKSSSQFHSDSEEEIEQESQTEIIEGENDFEFEGSANDDMPSERQEPHMSQEETITSRFIHQRLNLCLRRNITSLGDPKHHKPKPTYASDRSIPFDSWLENAIVAISPTGDIVLFAGQIPDKTTFIAKLRMDPINQYVTKPLNIPLDYNEQVCSLLCLPIMSTQKTASGLVDWTTLVIGLSSGYVKFYTEQNICLLSLKFCDEPVVSLKCQTQKYNPNGRSEIHFSTIVDELLITYRSLAIVADGVGLYENLRIAKNEVITSDANYEPAYDLTNLPSILNCQKWKIEESSNSHILDGELLGIRKTTTFDSLKAESVNFDHIPAKSYAKTLAFVGKNPFISCCKESTDTTSHSYTEIIGSIFSLWNKPQPPKTQIVEISKYNNLSFFDKERLATSIVASPDRRLAAITDDFGRVLLLDCTNLIVIRMWKGYRSAQCGWIEVKRNLDNKNSPHASFLVIYAPRRGLLEVWSAQRGPRVAAFNVGKHCRLLYSGYKMFNMRSDKSNNTNHPSEQSYSAHCYLLNAKSETIFSVEIPYTYSLYKYGDLKSRDHLLINELNNALQNDPEIEQVSEILHRIALPQSLQVSIQKIAFTLLPEKIVPILENLINKTMKNYDNHSGETITHDDMSIIELCKRLIGLSSMFKDLSELMPHELSLPDVNQRLIDEYEEHPEEVDSFSEQLGWSTTEVLRYLSLLSLERSYREKHVSNPWPSTGEPLAWIEFISCFDLKRIKSCRKSKKHLKSPNELRIKLKQSKSKFLNQDRVVKTAIFMYNRLSEIYYKNLPGTTNKIDNKSNCTNKYNYIEPSHRLGLLFQFWLSTKLCNHWKMWLFLQDQVGLISDELKVLAIEQNDDSILIETWKQIYNLILDSDNIFAAITATAAIRSDTLRMIEDNEKREKIDQEQVEDEDESKIKSDGEVNRPPSIDWECLCIDAERMSLLCQQLEDVFIINLLLNYDPNEAVIKDNYYTYRIPRISVANLLRGGPTIVSELVAQWAIQTKINLKIFTQPYGKQLQEEDGLVLGSSDSLKNSKLNSRRIYSIRQTSLNNEEYAKELIHHTKTSFPCSLEPDIILLYSIWELGRIWTNQPASLDKTNLLNRVYAGISLLNCYELRHKLTSAAFKTFFQRTLERLVILVETNSTIVNVKSSRLRDTLTRKELNISEDCLEEFVQFCCDLSEFMLQTCTEQTPAQELQKQKEEIDLMNREKLLRYDNWWSTPTMVKMLEQQNKFVARRKSSSDMDDSTITLTKTILKTSNLLNVNFLVELNRLANLLNLIFKLKVIKAYPITLIGEESRQILQLDLHQAPIGGASFQTNLKNRIGSLNELRYKFARKCILNIVTKISEQTLDFDEDEESKHQQNSSEEPCKSKAVDIRMDKSPFILDKSNKNKNKKQQRRKNKLPFNRENNDATSIKLNEETKHDDDDDDNSHNQFDMPNDDNNEAMSLFTNLLSLIKDWQMNCDELHLEFAFELYRCNYDKLASQISTRIIDQKTLASGLLKISSQRVLVLFGLSPYISESSNWKCRTDLWSMFQPNVSSWLKSIQNEEIKREIACLNFSNSVRICSTSKSSLSNDESSYSDNKGQQDSQLTKNQIFGVQLFVLNLLRRRTKLVLESITNHLEGQAERLAYDLLELLESETFDNFLKSELHV